jgi:hypothetical protein
MSPPSSRCGRSSASSVESDKLPTSQTLRRGKVFGVLRPSTEGAPKRSGGGLLVRVSGYKAAPEEPDLYSLSCKKTGLAPEERHVIRELSMPLLAELVAFIVTVCYRDFAPTELGSHRLNHTQSRGTFFRQHKAVGMSSSSSGLTTNIPPPPDEQDLVPTVIV